MKRGKAMDNMKDAIVRVVDAARYAMKLAYDMKPLMISAGGWSVADHIAGLLEDALFSLCGEVLEPGQDFMRDSETMEMLSGSMSNEEVAEKIMEMGGLRQPKPNTITKAELQQMFREFGGYPTPEGEWK